MYHFIADEHYYHINKKGEGILSYMNRPFDDMEEMVDTMVGKHNEVVEKRDITVHGGDFYFGKKKDVGKFIKRLNGNHIFLKGDHDRWMSKSGRRIWTKKIDGLYVVVCHYAMHTWPRSHLNSLHLYAHSHRELNLPGKRICISADATGFYPLPFEEIKEWMVLKGDNPNFMLNRGRGKHHGQRS